MTYYTTYLLYKKICLGQVQKGKCIKASVTLSGMSRLTMEVGAQIIIQ